MLGALFPIHKQGEARVSSERKFSQKNAKICKIIFFKFRKLFFAKMNFAKGSENNEELCEQKDAKIWLNIAKKSFSPFYWKP